MICKMSDHVYDDGALVLYNSILATRFIKKDFFTY